MTTEVTVKSPSRASRGLALLVDFLLLTAIGFTVSAVVQLFGIDHTQERLMVIVIAVLWLPYSVTMLAAAGGTLGKRLVGLRVVTTNGDPLDAPRAFRREIWRVAFAAGIVWPIDYLAALGKRRMTIHDRWSETTVVRMRARLRTVAPTMALAGLSAVAVAMQYLSHYLARH